MTKINAKWKESSFGIDTDGKLKLHMDVQYDGDNIPKQIQLILAFDCLASIALKEGMDPTELFTVAFMNRSKRAKTCAD